MMMKRNWCTVSSVLVLLLLLSQQSFTAQGRALRFTDGATLTEGEGGSSVDSMPTLGIASATSLAASSNDHADIDLSSLMKSLAFRLASGPSKRGPGH